MGGKKDTEYSFEANTKILIRLHSRKGTVKDTVREGEEQMWQTWKQGEIDQWTAQLTDMQTRQIM